MAKKPKKPKGRPVERLKIDMDWESAAKQVLSAKPAKKKSRAKKRKN